MCPWPLQRWQRPYHRSVSFCISGFCCAGIVYILSISVGMGGVEGGVNGGVERYSFMGEGVCRVNSLVWQAFKLVRMA